MSKYQTYQELAEAIEGSIEELKASDIGSLVDNIKKMALEGLLDTVEEAQYSSEGKKQNLVFVGAIGSGKTTAITHLLGLVDEGGEDLLVTGAGGSTVCEVHIRLTLGYSYFEVEWIEEDELYMLVDSFADAVIGKKYPATQLGDALPAEVTRSLRNILNLKIRREGNKRVDEALELLESISGTEEEKKETFRDILFYRIEERIEMGQPSCIYYEEWTEQEQFIKETFTNLNNSTEQEFTIPNRITLFLDKDEFLSEEEISIWDKYEYIIDTKGLDRPTGREDIDHAINQYNTVVVFTSTFPDAPQTDSFAQLQRFVERNEESWMQSCQLMVLPRYEQPKEVVGAEDYEDGLYLKREVIESRLRELTTEQLREDLVVFYNAKSRNQKTETIQKLLRLAERQEAVSITESAIELDYEEITNFTTVTQEAQQKIKDVLKIVYHTEFDLSNDFNEHFTELLELDAPHWNTKNAINKYKGVFWNHNIYFLAIDVVQYFLRHRMAAMARFVLNRLDEELRNSIEFNFDFVLAELWSRGNIKRWEIREKFIEHLQKTIFNQSNTNPLWEKLNWYNIRGHGYNQRVLDIYKEALQPMNTKLAQIAQEGWRELMDNFMASFGVDIENNINLPYQLQAFTIENYQGIGKIETLEIPKDQKCIILTGENGYGKTSILRGILAGLLGGKDGEAKPLVIGNSKIELTYQAKGEVITNSIEGTNSGESIPLQQIAAYGAHRIGLGTTEKTTVSEHLFDHDNDYATPFINIEEELIKWEFSEKQLKYYIAVRAILLNFLEDYIEDIRVKRTGNTQTVEYKEVGKDSYTTYKELASGFKTVLGLVGDIVIRLSSQPSDNLNFLSGIVIIDEFDMHLHPIWQKKILLRLNKYFPRVQFILSTHSPIPFLGAPANTTVIKVDRNEEDAQISASILEVDFSELLPNAILSSPIFKFRELIPEAHDGEHFPETADQYEEIKAIKEEQDENAVYYDQKHTDELLALLKEKENEEGK